MRDAIATIHAALDRGINLVDTAAVYGFGASETIVGKALAGGRRDKAIIATKATLEWDADGNVVRNGTRRLQTDRIDIYQVHWPDPLVPIEVTAGAMKDLLDSGKIRGGGVSNYSAEQMERFARVCPLHTSRPPFNLFERDAENEILRYCAAHGVNALTYGALCRGLLSGRMSKETQFRGDDLRVYVESAIDFHVDAAARAEIDSIIEVCVPDPIGPEFMAPGVREA
ncbi:MAG TPA: aldo/keto reductase [Candidatus Baltobacteraceae bacterium]|nr:aldo/keto reductase [Candidatus Baltobacteraceae bacterium]